jgi:hypothetical protein
LGNSGPLKRQNEQRTQYFRDYEKSKRSRQFLKEWKQNRPWLPFYIIALLSFNYKVQICAFKGDAQNLPLRRVGRGRSHTYAIGGFLLVAVTAFLCKLVFECLLISYSPPEATLKLELHRVQNARSFPNEKLLIEGSTINLYTMNVSLYTILHHCFIIIQLQGTILCI